MVLKKEIMASWSSSIRNSAPLLGRRDRPCMHVTGIVARNRTDAPLLNPNPKHKHTASQLAIATNNLDTFYSDTSHTGLRSVNFKKSQGLSK